MINNVFGVICAVLTGLFVMAATNDPMWGAAAFVFTLSNGVYFNERQE